jgi:hypothetical protein
VRHGAQHGGLDDVAAPQGRGLHHLGEQRVALAGRGQQRLEAGHDALLQSPQAGLGQVAGHEQRAEQRRAIAQRERHALPAGLDRVERDVRRRQLEGRRQPPRRGGERRAQVVGAQEQAGHLGREVRLAAAIVGLRGAGAGQLGHRAGDERDGQEHAERHPVLGVGDREAPGRRDVEPVEGQRAGHRGEDAQPRAPHRRHDEDADEVEDAERHGGRELPQREGDERLERDERGGREHADRPGRRRGAQKA